MSTIEDSDHAFQQEDHQAAYVFKPNDEDGQVERPPKRRRISKKVTTALDDNDVEPNPVGSVFVPLLNGAETPECLQVREKLFRSSWSRIDTNVQKILRDANQATLGAVKSFVLNDPDGSKTKIPSAFISTGPNIASQDLLFEQLSDDLQSATPSKFVRLRSSEASNLKGALKKIIRDVTSRASDDDEDNEIAFGQDGRKYLNYDLESLYSFIKGQDCQHVFVAFQDSEGFDSNLLSDLILLFHSWRPKIPFTLLFGVATSVELLQARLLKSRCQLLYGSQFDVVQTSTILEQIFRVALAGNDVLLRLGPSLLQSLIERQHDQVTGTQVFISSLKYAYMCHFYANPLSVFAVEDVSINSELVQSEHLEGFRSLPSFRRYVEEAVESGNLSEARSLLDADEYLREKIFDIPEIRRKWLVRLLRSLHLLEATRVQQEEYPQMYMRAMSEGISLLPENTNIIESIKRLQPDDFISMLQRLHSAIIDGAPTLHLQSWASESEALVQSLNDFTTELTELRAQAEQKGKALRSSYSGQSKVLRTTVVAQKVQLSRDSAALSDEDKAFTKIVDHVTELLTNEIQCEPAANIFLNETWLYDSKTPYRDVFIPRPRVVIERSLTRPHDYLSCTCCSKDHDGISSTFPVTSLLYHLYLETGNLINVADLWSAFFALVGEGEDGEGSGGYDERTALVLFYRGLAELRALGFVKSSRKKVDHMAKLKWL